MKSRFICILIFFCGLSAQAQKPKKPSLDLHHIENSKIKMSWMQGEIVHVLVNDSVKLSGELKLLNQEQILIGEDTVNIHQITRIWSLQWVDVGAIVISGIAIYITPLAVSFPLAYFVFYASGNFCNMEKYVLQTNFEDTLGLSNKYPANPNVIRRTELRKYYSTGDFIRVGVPIEKLFVPNFCLDLQYYNNKHWGLGLQFGYRPPETDGINYLLSWRTNVDFMSEAYMSRLSFNYWYKTKKRHYAFFMGPSLYYKFLTGDSVRVITYRDSDYYSWATYWHRKFVGGAAMRFGNIPQSKLGVGWSVEIGFRCTYTNDYIEPDHSDPYKSAGWGYYPVADASIIFSFGIRKHRHWIEE